MLVIFIVQEYLQVNEFANVELCRGEDDISTYGNDFSLIDSGIGSRPSSRANTNETLLSECTEESGLMHPSFRYRMRNWCDKDDYGNVLKILISMKKIFFLNFPI